MATPRPAWAWFFGFVRPPDELDSREWSLIGLLGLTVLVNHYDIGILNLALPQIQDGLGVPEERISQLVSVVRLGVVPALVFGFLADRVGRRRLLLVTLAGFTLCTAATAFARDAAEFAALQFSARVFMTAEEMIAVVVIAEELNARARGFALGMLAAFGALGHAVSAIGFGFVEVLPHGWRALYLLGAIPLLALVWVRRRLPETRRFEAERAARPDSHRLRDTLQPLFDLAGLYPGRLLGLVAAVLPASVLMVPAATLVSKTLQEVHGYAPSQITVLFLVAGFAVFAGNLIAGKLADRFGRRRVIVGLLLFNALGVAVFYNGAGALVVAAWMGMMFGFVGVDVLFGALGTELFPTSYRSTASAVRALAWTVGGSIGLWIEGPLFVASGDHGTALTWMLAGAWLAPIAIALLPETAGRELDEIAPGRAELEPAP